MLSFDSEDFLGVVFFSWEIIGDFFEKSVFFTCSSSFS
jgi:hypothetical protein